MFFLRFKGKKEDLLKVLRGSAIKGYYAVAPDRSSLYNVFFLRLKMKKECAVTGGS